MDKDITAIFYTDEKFHPRGQELIGKIYGYGFKSVIWYTRKWLLTTDFYQENKRMLDMPRGSGYWLWKPYIILDAFKKSDIVFYFDAGDELFYGIVPALHSLMQDRNYVLCAYNHRHGDFTKRDCFIAMGCDEERYHNARQIETGSILLRNTETALVNEWMDYCKTDIVTDIPSVAENLQGFIEHRHDQSILTNLAIKYGLETTDKLRKYISYNYWTPCGYWSVVRAGS